MSRTRRTATSAELRPGAVAIVPYGEPYAAAFRSLNLAWIERFFVPEPADYAALDDPERYILERGGRILCAVHQPTDELLGVVALIPLSALEAEPITFELAKMAVAEKAQGLGIGRMVGEAAIAAARDAGADRVWLESNRTLEPAINLYRSLGFVEVPFTPSHYARADIQMELHL